MVCLCAATGIYRVSDWHHANVGVLELLPAAVFLSIMKPSVERGSNRRNTQDDASEANRDSINRPSSFGRLESAAQRSNSSRRGVQDARVNYGAIEHPGSSAND